jgi:hypothetical protein
MWHLLTHWALKIRADWLNWLVLPIFAVLSMTLLLCGRAVANEVACATDQIDSRLIGKLPSRCIKPPIDANGSLNLSDWGASGSSQVMSCGAIAESRSLSGCSAGDFKPGQFVRIPSAGFLPTIATPGIPILVCKPGNGASCAGSTIYSYRIAAVQGRPNGAITPAGPETSLNQSTQTALAAIGQVKPYIATFVSWQPVPGASLYLIYKSTNSSSSNFYIATTATSITDYGDSAPPGFSCADYGFPCTAPQRALADDVFAQIAATSDHSVRISPDPLPPHFHQGLSGAYPAIPYVSGPVLLHHDETPAFQAIYHYLINADHHAPTTITIPRGEYNVYSADPYGAERAFNIMGLSNVSIQGIGWDTRIHQVGDREYGVGSFIWSPCGYVENEATELHVSERCGGVESAGETYDLSDPATAGSSSVKLQERRASAKFTAGEYVVIWDHGGRYPGNMWKELNRVTKVDSTDQVLHLQRPLDKMYSSRLTSIYAECSVCSGTPKVSPLPYGPVADHITLSNFRYDGADTFFNVSTTSDVILDRLNIHAVVFNEDGTAAQRMVSNSTIAEDSNNIRGGEGLAVGADGSRDIRVIGNNYVGRGPNVLFQWCQEGTSNVVWRNNVIRIVGTQDVRSTSALVVSTCMGARFDQNRVDILGTNLYSVFGWAGPGPWVFGATGNEIHVDAFTRSGVGVLMPIQTNTIRDRNYIRIERNTWYVARAKKGTAMGREMLGGP